MYMSDWTTKKTNPKALSESEDEFLYILYKLGNCSGYNYTYLVFIL